MFYFDYKKEFIAEYYLKSYTDLLSRHSIIAAISLTWQDESLILEFSMTTARNESDRLKTIVDKVLNPSLPVKENSNDGNSITLSCKLTLSADKLEIDQEKIKYINKKTQVINNSSPKKILVKKDLENLSIQIKKESNGKRILENAIKEGLLNPGIICYALDGGFIYEERINNETTPSWFIGDKVYDLKLKKELLQLAAEQNQSPIMLNGTESEFEIGFRALAQEGKLTTTVQNIVKKTGYKDNSSLKNIFPHILRYHIKNSSFLDAAEFLYFIYQNGYKLNAEIPLKLIEACIRLQPKLNVEFIKDYSQMLPHGQHSFSQALREAGYTNKEILTIAPDDIQNFFTVAEIKSLLNETAPENEAVKEIRSGLEMYQNTFQFFPNSNSKTLSEKLSLFFDRIDLKKNYSQKAEPRTLSSIEKYALYCLLQIYVKNIQNQEENLYKQLYVPYQSLEDEILELPKVMQDLHKTYQEKDKEVSAVNLIKETAHKFLHENEKAFFKTDDSSITVAQEIISQTTPSQVFHCYFAYLNKNQNNELTKQLSSQKQNVRDFAPTPQ